MLAHAAFGAVAWRGSPRRLHASRPALARLLRAIELRIDVEHAPDTLEAELQALYDRLYQPGDCLHDIAATPSALPGLVVRYREADGEYYFYVEDTVRRCLAGYTVFNRLVELDRRADRHLRAPHSKFAPPYQRRGLASAIYRSYLDAGHCLITGARQSPGAHALWHALAADYERGYVELRDKALRYLGSDVTEPVLDKLHTRMVLLGRGWTMAALAEATGMVV
ncbi:N-acetyltransferase [Cupriavidus sp. JZ107]